MRRGTLLSALSALIVASTLAVVPVAYAAFPGENGRIAYVTTVGDHRAIYTVSAQGLDPQPLIDLGSGRDAINPAWSWDGESIAFAGQTSPGGTFAIYVANADGSGTPRQVTTPPISDTDPTWEPNGRQIAFTRRLDGDGSVIAIVALSTEAVVSSWSGLGMSMEPSWSPDGRSIAFATKDPKTSCYPIDCRFQIWKLSLDGNTFVPAALDFGYDLHDPDWSPDGSLIVARLGRDEDPPYGASGVGIYDSTTGEQLVYLGPCHIMSEPSFSPDGQYVVLTSRPVADPLTGELREPNLCVIRTDNTDGYLLEGSPPRSDAAWGPVPGSPPAPSDTLPPTIEFRPDPSASEWLDPSSAGYVEMIATDDRSLPSLACTNDNSPMRLVITQIGVTTKGVAKLPEGSNHLVCTATDEAGNSTTVLATYRVDLTPPSIVGPIVAPSVARVGEIVSASATVSDVLSLLSAEFEVLGTGSDPLDGGPMSGPGWSFSASFVPSRPDLWRVVVTARDRAGWVTESAVPFVAYDPLAGSADGSGWIVPGGPTSDTGDVMPGLDGARKASFAFSAMYKTPSSETPGGNLTFSYGSKFKLQSKSLSWLAVRDAHIAYLGGLASIQGKSGEFPFVAVIVDGASTASPDRFELRVYEPGTNISSPTPLFAASGDVGGQIQIKR